MTFNSELLKQKINLLKGAEEVQRKRFSTVFTMGRPVNTEILSDSFIGNVQPATGKMIDYVEEGDRKRERLLLVTRTEVILKDTIIRGGTEYMVENVEAWGPHFEAILVRKDVVQ